jgi:hypothetical protein
MLFAVFPIVIAIAIGAIIAWPEAAGAILDDFYTWFRYFAGPIRRG